MSKKREYFQIFGLVVLGVFLASLQVRVFGVALLSSFVYLVYIFYGFEKSLWVGSVAGVFFDVLRAASLGITGLWMAGMLGVYHFVTSEYPLREGGLWARFLGFLPFLAVDGLIGGFSLGRLVGGVVGYFFLYFGVSYFADLTRDVRVRR